MRRLSTREGGEEVVHKGGEVRRLSTREGGEEVDRI